MRYTLLPPLERAALLEALEGMPAVVGAAFGGLTSAQAVLPGPEGAFSPVDHAWHLAHLEREGYALRIQRLLAEERPHLADFDGAGIARERRYRSLSLATALRPSPRRAARTRPRCAASRAKPGPARARRRAWERWPCATCPR